MELPGYCDKCMMTEDRFPEFFLEKICCGRMPTRYFSVTAVPKPGESGNPAFPAAVPAGRQTQSMVHSAGGQSLRPDKPKPAAQENRNGQPGRLIRTLTILCKIFFKLTKNDRKELVCSVSYGIIAGHRSTQKKRQKNGSAPESAHSNVQAVFTSPRRE
jgi:hypothetical protein